MFLTIKAKYYVIEPYYMDGTTPEQLVEHTIDILSEAELY